MKIFRYGRVLSGITIISKNAISFEFFTLDLVFRVVSLNSSVEAQLLTLRTSGQNQDLHTIYHDNNICAVRQCGLDFGTWFSNNLWSWRRDAWKHDFLRMYQWKAPDVNFQSEPDSIRGPVPLPTCLSVCFEFIAVSGAAFHYELWCCFPQNAGELNF